MIYRVDLMKRRIVKPLSAVVAAMVWALEDDGEVTVCNVVTHVTCGH